MRADLLHPNLNPRPHVLGSDGAAWGGVDIGTDGYKHGEGVDLENVRPYIYWLPNHPQYSGVLTNVNSQGGGYDTDYHPAKLHPETGDYSKEHADA